MTVVILSAIILGFGAVGLYLVGQRTQTQVTVKPRAAGLASSRRKVG